jgi:hypothetical protein
MNDSIMRKLGKIKAHQESAEKIGSEAEAQAFAAMLNNLLLKHKLEMSDIEWNSEVQDEPVDTYRVGGDTEYREHKRWMKDFPDIEIKGRRIAWSEELGRICADANACKMLISSGSSILWFVGRKSNVAVAEYTYVVMYRTIESMSWKEYKTLRNKIKWAQTKQGIATADVDYGEARGYRESWIAGFINKLSQIFYEERMKQMQPDGTQSTALVRIDKDKLAVRDYMRTLSTGKAKHINRPSGSNDRGYNDGAAAANRANANRKAGVGTSDVKKIGGGR